MFDVVYRDARGRLTRLVGALTGEQLRTPVPATSAWTVHELVAHLVGGAADTASGRLDGAPGDEWTARHVAERRQRPVGELLAEWVNHPGFHAPSGFCEPAGWLATVRS